MAHPAKNIDFITPDNAEKTVRQVMKPLESFSSISADITVKNALYVLKSSMTAQSTWSFWLLVFESKQLTGVLGVPELLASVQPPNLREDWYRGWNLANWTGPAFMPGLFTNLCREVAEKPVRDVMAPVAPPIAAGSTLAEAVYIFHREKINILPVGEKDNLVGMLLAGDLFDEMVSQIY